MWRKRELGRGEGKEAGGGIAKEWCVIRVDIAGNWCGGQGGDGGISVG